MWRWVWRIVRWILINLLCSELILNINKKIP